MTTRVLVIDDDPAIRDLLLAVLTQEGYAATAVDSVAGLASALTDPPDLILLDWLMPKIDGVQVAAVLRAHPATAHVPIILLTAYIDADRHFLGTRINAILHKPFPLADLIAQVRRIIPHVPQGEKH